MKKLLISLLALSSVSAFAVDYERGVPCNIYNSDVKDLFKNGSTKELARACAIQNASKHGERVCESDGFSWQRADYPEQNRFSHSTYLGTECKKIKVNDDALFEAAIGYKCTSRLIVTCY